MKKVFWVLMLICFGLKTFSQNQFTFSGKITGVPKASVNLSYTNSKGEHVNDICELKSGAFNFKGEISEAQMVFLTAFKDNFKLLDDDNPNKVSFFLEPGIITTTDCNYNHLKETKIIGSKSQDESASLNKYVSSVSEKKYGEILRQFITTHTNSNVSAFNLLINFNDLTFKFVKTAYNDFSSSVQNGIYGKEIRKQITDIDNSVIGKKAISFSSIDLNKKTFDLSSLKGHYILIDFWASWCGPCRQSIPHLKKLFNKYHKNGLDVIAVADDDNSILKWEKAIKEDKTELWENILEGKIFNAGNIDDSNSISRKYAVSFIPTRILIDQDGIIIGRYVGTDNTVALDKKLSKLFKL